MGNPQKTHKQKITSSIPKKQKKQIDKIRTPRPYTYKREAAY